MSRPVEVSRSPWWNAHGYRAATVRYADGSTRTVYEHREIVEAAIGRDLGPDEVVHHRDGTRDNNDPSNLEVLTKSEHARHHALRGGPELVSLTCIACGSEFQREARFERHNRAQEKRGPYCGKRCAGRASRARQIERGQVNLRTSEVA